MENNRQHNLIYQSRPCKQWWDEGSVASKYTALWRLASITSSGAREMSCKSMNVNVCHCSFTVDLFVNALSFQSVCGWCCPLCCILCVCVFIFILFHSFFKPVQTWLMQS